MISLEDMGVLVTWGLGRSIKRFSRGAVEMDLERQAFAA